MNKKLNSKYLFILIIIFISIGVYIKFVLPDHEEILFPMYKEYRKIKVGMTQDEVENILGEPYKIYFKDTAPKDYYIDGYYYKKRYIKNKVFIYIDGEPISYIYFNDDDNVEYVYIGGS